MYFKLYSLVNIKLANFKIILQGSKILSVYIHSHKNIQVCDSNQEIYAT